MPGLDKQVQRLQEEHQQLEQELQVQVGVKKKHLIKCCEKQQIKFSIVHVKSQHLDY